MAITIPIDYERCQAEKPNGANFMTMGGRPRMERCKNKPSVVVTESQPNPLDGCKGSMSLCDECYEVMKKQLGEEELRRRN